MRTGAIGPGQRKPWFAPGRPRAMVRGPLDALCVHLPEADYGTRSSTVLAHGPAPRELSFAPGRPCVTPYEDLSALLE